MSNFKHAAYETLSFWSMKSALRLLDTKRTDFVGDVIEASSDVRVDMQLAQESSKLMEWCLKIPLTADMIGYRTVRSFTRGPVEVRCGDWVLVQMHGRSYVGRATEMMDMHMGGVSVLRMMLSESRAVSFEDETRGQVLSVRRDTPSYSQLVQLESSGVHEVVCDESDATELRYTYSY